MNASKYLYLFIYFSYFVPGPVVVIFGLLGNLKAIFEICIYFTTSRYAANKSMDNCAFCSADGDFLIVPQKGSK